MSGRSPASSPSSMAPSSRRAFGSSTSAPTSRTHATARLTASLILSTWSSARSSSATRRTPISSSPTYTSRLCRQPIPANRPPCAKSRGGSTRTKLSPSSRSSCPTLALHSREPSPFTCGDKLALRPNRTRALGALVAPNRALRPKRTGGAERLNLALTPKLPPPGGPFFLHGGFTMPKGYEKMRDKFKREGMDSGEARGKAARIWNSRNPDRPVGRNEHKKGRK